LKKKAFLWWVLLPPAILFFCYPVGYFILDSKPKHIDFPFSITGGEGVGAYLINLDRSKERYESIKPYVDQLNLPTERIEAVDGSKLSEDEIKEKVDLEACRIFLGYTPKRGTIGCSLSHIKLWQTFLKSNYKYALVFEDDVSFEPKKLKVVIEDVLKNSTLWDIVNFEINCDGRMPVPIKTLVNNHQLCLYLSRSTHTGCYMINRKAAKHLLEKALPIKMPVDHYFTRSWELGVRYTGVENPTLVHQTFGDSIIEQTKILVDENIKSVFFLKTRVDENISSVVFLKIIMCATQTSIIRFLYNLKEYVFGSR
jgi:glycosyl transferase family 25